MIGHLGPRVSALLDGQLSPEETERAWAHVHACHSCRDLVEREGWVKTQLASLSFDSGHAPDTLLGSLRTPAFGGEVTAIPAAGDPRRTLGLAALGGGAVGAAVLGVLALGAAVGDSPTIDRRAPVSQVTTPSSPATTPGSPVPARQRDR